MGKRVRLTDDSLNSYGTRVLTAGMDISQYEKNPVLLYMHRRGTSIGKIENLRREADGITGEPVFDEATDLSQQCKKQWEFGSLRMVSVGIDIVETSDAAEHLVVGQTSPTITKSRLYEVSLVDIGANDNAIVLRRDGKQITMGADGENPLPLLNNNNQSEPKSREMETKTLALQLGLPETADEAAIGSKIAELKAAKEEADRLKEERERLTEAAVNSAVEGAIRERRISADKRDQFVQLGKTVGVETLNATFGAMTPAADPKGIINRSSGSRPAKSEAKYSKLSEVPAAELSKLKEEDEQEYRRLYRAEYGIDY